MSIKQRRHVLKAIVPLFVLALSAGAMSACGDNNSDTASTEPTVEEAPTTTVADDPAFNEEVYDRFGIVDVVPVGSTPNSGELEPGVGDVSNPFLQPVSPAEAAQLYICGDELPDGYELSYQIVVLGDAPSIIGEFEDYARATYCPTTE